ncbi:molybdate ABC transporter substrate-binding protein [Ramlibacter sp. USB13]|uniref:Molybdate ABC transporter substrate-binding protein n=1 Tax=Ramlibacter cellulosilyticus TaxID=2764187 RepID=A0A923MT77_9BURK|nr:molybdate ABC transporter substrate-binding protein [Ramlibacter cellulosilyticus]MBC5784808.1 molybdate ABC transporter substrate-binding protein [Ramlibacter cellulosilyticus]
MLRRLALLLALAAPLAAAAGEVQVAAAANLAGPIQKIAAAFKRDTGHEAIVSLGSTGKLFAQVRNGAPFEVLLAADAETPRKLEAEGLARPGTRYTYAFGQLVLWSATGDVVDARGEVLRRPQGKLAIADPRVAPYGAAALEVLKALNLEEGWQPLLVTGENIGQAYQFAASGNARLAFVALSQVAEAGLVARGSGWVVPASLYQPLQQDAVLLQAGVHNPVASLFLAYLRTNAARAVLRAAGYKF